ncbi:MAG TPA: MraY family glycosyltransferase [Syntrophales bacterium]|nr:MraY family glycosyltransferase [Syntrophales bacterium]
MNYFSALLLSLLLTITVTPILVRAGRRFGIVDIPNARKIHTQPVPRVGGVAIALGCLVTTVLLQPGSDFIVAYLAGAGILVVLGMVDDIRGVDYRVKFPVQLIAALIVVFYGGVRITSLGGLLPEGSTLHPWLGCVLTLLAIVGVTNAINLADGLDGLAGGVCFLCLCSISFFAYVTEQTVILYLAVTLAGAVFGFLRFNTYPATLFMGDAGSLFLGFSMITLSLAITQDATPLSPLLPLLILGLPVLDTITVMAERIAHGRSPFAADKSHLHHRIMRLGFSHSESVFLIYLLQAGLITAAIFLRYHSEWLILAGYLVFSGAILAVFSAAAKTGWKVKRLDLIDRVIKGRLKAMILAGLLSRMTFRTVEYGLPLLLWMTCFVPATVPLYFQILSGGLLGLLSSAFLMSNRWLRRSALSLSLYLFIPVLVFSAVTHMAPWMGTYYQAVYGAVFLVLLFFVVLVLKFSRRKRGFHITPMDFLILFLVFVVPMILGPYQQYENFRLIMAMTIMLFFSYEVLMGELRENLVRLAVMTMTSLLTIVIRGFT